MAENRVLNVDDLVEGDRHAGPNKMAENRALNVDHQSSGAQHRPSLVGDRVRATSQKHLPGDRHARPNKMAENRVINVDGLRRGRSISTVLGRVSRARTTSQNPLPKRPNKNPETPESLRSLGACKRPSWPSTLRSLFLVTFFKRSSACRPDRSGQK